MPFINTIPTSIKRTLILIIIFMACLLPLNVLRATPINYYVDCNSGNDTNNGTSTGSAWRTLTRGSQAPLQPDDSLQLKRGCIWTDQLVISKSGATNHPILITAYGSGNPPTITGTINNSKDISVTGSFVIIENVLVNAVPPSLEAGCNNNPKGRIYGVFFESGSHENILRNSQASALYAGAIVVEGSYDNQILNNQFIDNKMMGDLDPDPDNDAGAFGVLLQGDANIVRYNYFSGQYACSYDYVEDGSAVEVYGGQHNRIAYNKAVNNDAFTELGYSRSLDNVFAYNAVTSTLSRSTFLVTRGNADFGPVLSTKVYNNTAVLTGSKAQAVVCIACNANILTLKNNILWANAAALAADNAFDEGYNLYWRTGGNPYVQIPVSPTSIIADPLFLNPVGFDFSLQANSPARDKGSNEALNAGYTVDLVDTAVPQGAAVDIGAFEVVGPHAAARNRTVGIFRPSTTTFYLRNSNTTGIADITTSLGASTDLPITGDWNGDGIDTVGIYRPSTAHFYLRNSNSVTAPIVYDFTLGVAGDLPMAGDWTGVGRDGVGVFRPTNGLIYLKNIPNTGYADYQMVLGVPGDRPLAGDWDGNGISSPGVYRPSIATFFLTNQVCNCGVVADYTATLGTAGDSAFAGDWDGNGASGIGIFRPSNGLIYLKNTPTTGYADLSLIFGIPNDLPVAGHWVISGSSIAPTFVP